jgi:CD2 antigen cytoplasmic tail-binding protein 2
MPNNKAVRFAAEEDSRPAKRARIDRPNVDEDDDVDEWINDERGGDTDLPSERDLMDAKRKRRMKRQGTDNIDDEDDGNVEEDDDEPTSLMAERKQQQQLNGTDDMAADIPVEPFNMKAERSDGSGYFEGDTYIFRKRDEEGEPDAWLDSLNNDNDDKKGSQLAKPRAAAAERARDNNMDDWTREELYATILPLVSDSENILQALVRYGDLIKRHKKTQSKQPSTGSSSSASLSQTALSQLTEASNALLLQGDVDIYQKTRQAIMKMVPDTPPPPKVMVQWEYKGNQDGEVHGPYSTADMLGWTQAGYFIGAQAVQIRTVQKGNATATEESSKTIAEDLLSDLMDDDDDKEEQKKEPPMVKGEWVSSNDVNFKAYG